MIQKSKRKYDCVSLLQCVNKKIDKLINTNSEKLITKKKLLYANVKDHIFISYQWHKYVRNTILLWSLYTCLIMFSIHTAAVVYFYYLVLSISLTRVTWDSSNAQVGLLHNETSIQFNVDSVLASLYSRNSYKTCYTIV